MVKRVERSFEPSIEAARAKEKRNRHSKDRPMSSFPDIVQRLRFGLPDEGVMDDGAAEIERLRAELSTAEKIIYDLTDGITGTTQRDELAEARRGVWSDHAAGSSAGIEEANSDLVEILEELSGVIEAVRGERDVLRVSGLLGDRQDIGVVGIDGFQELLRRTCEELRGPRHDAQPSWLETVRTGLQRIVDLKNPMPRAAVREAVAELLSSLPSTPLCTPSSALGGGNED